MENLPIVLLVLFSVAAFITGWFLSTNGKKSNDDYQSLKSSEAVLIEKIANFEKENANLVNEHQSKNSLNLELNRICSGLESKVLYLEESVKGGQKDIDDLKHALENSRILVTSLSSQKAAFENQIPSLEELLKKSRLENDDFVKKIDSFRANNLNLSSQVSALTSQLESKEELLKNFQEDNQKIKKINNEFQEKIIELSSKNSSLESQVESKEEQLKILKETFDDVRKQSKEEFENIANQILDSKTKSFTEQNEKNMTSILTPFKDKLNDFQTTVTKYREDEMKDSASLKTEIQNIYALNKKLSLDAENLTSALKGNKKTLGNWGEMILSRVLESSGLREGEEYILQAKEMMLESQEGGKQYPDAVIKLPEGKHVVIDSKVTLNSYDKYLSSETELERGILLKEFSSSIEKHILGLSEKKYDFNEKLTSPDFVLMFIPIEGAFATALQNDNKIFEYGWDKRIIIVSPTTLMVTLKTIESIWKQEKQNKNTLEIVRQAGDLYDKFHGFHDDLEAVGNSIVRTKENFDKSMSKLKTGKGNILGRFEKLKDLGAKATKKLALEFDED